MDPDPDMRARVISRMRSRCARKNRTRDFSAIRLSRSRGGEGDTKSSSHFSRFTVFLESEKYELQAKESKQE